MTGRGPPCLAPPARPIDRLAKRSRPPSTTTPSDAVAQMGRRGRWRFDLREKQRRPEKAGRSQQHVYTSTHPCIILFPRLSPPIHPPTTQMFALGRGAVYAGRRLLVRATPMAGPAAAVWGPQRSLASVAVEGYYKTSTGLVGLQVNPNAREDLIAQQKALLEKIKVRCFRGVLGVRLGAWMGSPGRAGDRGIGVGHTGLYAPPAAPPTHPGRRLDRLIDGSSLT